VHDGYVLTKSVSRSPIGGRLLNSCLQKAMEARGNGASPHHTA
jgi:actin-related protein